MTENSVVFAFAERYTLKGRKNHTKVRPVKVIHADQKEEEEAEEEPLVLQP